MKLNDSAKLQGHITVEVRGAKTGELIRRIAKNNVVCVGSKQAMASLMTQRSDEPNAADYNKIWSIYVGDGNTAPTTADTDLDGTNRLGKAVDQPITKDAGAVDGLIEVEMTLESGDFNGQTLRECGLFTRGDGTLPSTPSADQKMLARQVHGDIAKTSGITVAYTWRYQITT